jgi:hypothetical protein
MRRVNASLSEAFEECMSRTGPEDDPDYAGFRQQFEDELERNGLRNDGIFDWMEEEVDAEEEGSETEIYIT